MARTFRNTTSADLFAGGIRFPADGVPVNVSEHFRTDRAPFADLVAAGDLVEDGATPASVPNAEPSEREALIAGIIRGLPVDADHYTKAGKPEVDAINDALPAGVSIVTAAERDAVWKAMEA